MTPRRPSARRSSSRTSVIYTLRGYGSREERVIEIVARERPDLVVVTGDIVDGGDLEPARELFAKLHAPLGVWVVRGNWENCRPEVAVITLRPAS